jgi:rRNA maturation RNase YbeY
MAFPYRIPASAGMTGICGDDVLGDVIISIETAQREAIEAGVRLEERLVYLMIHAILHLLGYDHDRPGAKTLKMRRMEKRLFRHVRGSAKALRSF